MRAQLPKNTNTPQQYLKSDKWGMQQKIDGWRMLLSCGEKVETFNRKGDLLECPENIVDYFKAVSYTHLDVYKRQIKAYDTIIALDGKVILNGLAISPEMCIRDRP